MDESKQKALKTAIEANLRKFKVAILMHDVGLSGYNKQDSLIDSYTNVLMKEVTIRTKVA